MLLYAPLRVGKIRSGKDLPGFWDSNSNIREHILCLIPTSNDKKVYSTRKGVYCQKSARDKTWDVLERRDRALGYHHRDHAQCLVIIIIVKSSSKP